MSQRVALAAGAPSLWGGVEHCTLCGGMYPPPQNKTWTPPPSSPGKYWDGRTPPQEGATPPPPPWTPGPQTKVTTIGKSRNLPSGNLVGPFFGSQSFGSQTPPHPRPPHVPCPTGPPANI